MVKFKNKDGSNTAYAFACGYTQETENERGIWLRLYQECSVFQLRAFDTKNKKQIFWLSFDNMTDAKRAYNKFKTMLARNYSPDNLRIQSEKQYPDNF